MNKIIPFSSRLQSASLREGDVIELRDFSPFAKEKQSDSSFAWNTVKYRLLDSTPGKMLRVNERMPFTQDTRYDEIDFSAKSMPDVIEIKIPFSGTFRISAGFPVLDEEIGGVDLSLDEEGFVCVMPEYGGRYGRMIGLERGREYFVFWKNAVLNNSVIKIRVPFGTFAADTLCVNAALSCLRFERLADNACLSPVQGKADKTLIVVEDGFSPYALYGIPNESFDLRLNRAYKDCDVRIFMSQIMGPTLWKSDVNSYFGQELTPEHYKEKRICDVRAVKYIRDSIENNYDVFRVQTEACHKTGAEMHFSIRANLYFPESTQYLSGNDYVNGRFWHEHPELRLPDSCQLDYGKKEVRDFYLSLFREALENFDVDGINLDLTRWPKCLDSKYHSPDILIDFCREMRELADTYGKIRGKHIKVSLLLVEYYHSRCTLDEQAVDFEGLCSSGTLDFVCLETNRISNFAPTAHKYGVEIYGIVDTESPYFNNNSDDPLWTLPDGSVTDDPCAGSEFEAQKLVPTKPAPFEQVRLMDAYYKNGADGIAKINEFLGALYLRDCGHSKDVAQHAKEEGIFGQTAGDYIFVTDR